MKLKDIFIKKINKRQVNNDNIMVEYLFFWFNLQWSAEMADIMLWSLTYTAIVILSYKLNMLNEGFNLMIGWIIFKKAVVEYKYLDKLN